MAYTIYNTDGTVLLTLGDGKIDQKNTSITLIGKNVNSYGEYLNNNLIKLLENFASIDQPLSPLVGQLWYDTSTGRLKVYDRNSIFRSVGNLLLNDQLPTELAVGDFWFDTVNNQLYVSVDGQTTELIGPIDSSVFGTTGWVTEKLSDGATDHVVNSLYSNNSRVGILSTDHQFTLAASTSGFTTIYPGLNLSPSMGLKFIGTATSAESINGLDSSNFLRNDINQTTVGALTVKNNLGLVVSNSANENVSIYISSATSMATFAYNSTNKDFRLQITNASTGLTSALCAKASTKSLGVWTETPTYPLDVVGNTRIQGDLIVQGTVTNITSVSLQVNDINLELGYGQGSPSDIAANGGGITLHGATDHTLTWQNDGTGWNVNDYFNIPTGKTYKISGTTVLSYSSLGNGVTSAPGLTSVGVLTSLTVTNVLISGSTVQTVGTNKTLHLAASGTGTISVNNIRITEVATPTSDYDASTKKYVDDNLYLVGTKAFAVTLDVTSFPTQYYGENPSPVLYGVKLFLDQMFPITNIGDPVFDIPSGARAKVLCGTTQIITSTSTVDVNFATDIVDRNGVFNSALVVSGLAGSIAASLPTQTYTPSTTYAVQTWKVQDNGSGLEWTNIS